MVQEMLSGTELFIGAKYEPRFGHIILCGLGGIFVEVLGDVSSGLAPLTFSEADSMIRSLRAYKIIRGTRGKPGINESKFAEIIVQAFKPAAICNGNKGNGSESTYRKPERYYSS